MRNKQRNRPDIFHVCLRLWRRVELTAAISSSGEGPALLREDPASLRPRGLGGLGRSGQPALVSLWCGQGAERCWLARGPRSALGRTELQQAGRAGTDGPWCVQREAGAGCGEASSPGSGLRGRGETGSRSIRSPPELHTYLPTHSSLSRPADPVDAALLGSALFPARSRELVGVCVCKRALSAPS